VFLNAGPLATETLKNLVLPGIGKFTIIDHREVTARDLGNNFFLEYTSLGKSRAAETARLLHQHNDFVKEANHIQEDPVHLIETNVNFVRNYSIIVATELPEVHCRKLAAACGEADIPLVIVRANGLIGYIRVFGCKEHKIVESNLDFPPIDLRLSDPFPDIVNYAMSVDLDNLDSHLHSHVPYPVLLIRALSVWKQNHDHVPTRSEEKEAFKEIVRSMRRNPDEENFEEALNRVYMAYSKYSIPDEVQQILNDPKADQLVNDNFWILAHALRQFVRNEGNGSLPLLGSVPDMHSDTDSFITLQEIYIQKSQQDIHALSKYVGQNLVTLGRDPQDIGEGLIKLFCKNCLTLRLLKYRNLEDELTSPLLENLESHMLDFMTMEVGNGIWYLLLRASERFYTEHNRYPGERKDYADDYEELKKHSDSILKDFNMEADRVSDEHLIELCRFGNAQLHSIAAFAGGVAAQEIIKLITRKWVPLNNTFVYNGIKASSSSFEI